MNAVTTRPTTTGRRSTSRAEMADRAAWTPKVNTGTIECNRCHQLIRPGEEWHMGHPIDAPYASGNHDPKSRRPQHAKCNRTGLVVDQAPTFGW